jgi:hydroxypyruvate isomerase
LDRRDKMLKFAANLTFLFTELPFMKRFEAARKAGFNYVEFMFPYDFDLDEIDRQLKQYNLQLGQWGSWNSFRSKS